MLLLRSLPSVDYSINIADFFTEPLPKDDHQSETIGLNVL